MEQAKNRTQLYRLTLFTGLLVYYFWMAAQIPYAHDDWAWGTQDGINWLLEANVNSRYAGNAMVVALTRSPVLKTCVMGILFAFIPVVAVELIKKVVKYERSQIEEENRCIFLYILANALMLIIPTDTWMQTFGWVSGFSNYVTVSLAMLIYLLVLYDLETGKSYRTIYRVLLFFFGILMQLFVENVTVCVMVLTFFCCVRDFVLKRKVRAELLVLLAGNLIGTVIMFSSPIYSTLLETGTAVDGLRKLEIDRGAGLLSEIFRLIRFFLFVYPNQIWAANIWMICFICVFLAVFCLKKKGFVIRLVGFACNAVFLIYFLYVKFYGKVQFSSSWWTDAFSAGMCLLFFMSVLIQCFVLFDRQEKSTKFLVFVWLAAPAVMLPLVIVATGLGRCCLPTQMLQMLFCLMLTEKLWDCCEMKTVRMTEILFLALFGCICIWMGKVYIDIGAVKRERDHDVSLAQSGVVKKIQMKAFPHGQYLWNADPAQGSREEYYFREFYRIPDEVELWFDTWGAEP